MTSARKQKAKRRAPARLSKARLDRLVEEAVVDCYNESEQRVGLYTMIEDNFACHSRRWCSESPWSLSAST